MEDAKGPRVHVVYLKTICQPVPAPSSLNLRAPGLQSTLVCEALCWRVGTSGNPCPELAIDLDHCGAFLNPSRLCYLPPREECKAIIFIPVQPCRVEKVAEPLVRHVQPHVLADSGEGRNTDDSKQQITICVCHAGVSVDDIIISEHCLTEQPEHLLQ